MVRSPFPPGSLQLTWFGDAPGVWIDHAEAHIRDVQQTAVGLLGPEIRTGLGDRLADRDLHDTLGPAPMASVRATTIDLVRLIDSLLRRRPAPSWSPSVSWFHHATLVAVEIAHSRRILPKIRTAGLRWRAEWAPILDPIVEEVYADLLAATPPVVLAGSGKPAPSQISVIMDHLVDAVCRAALAEEDWRPPLPRTRATNVVALRRVTTALSKPDAVFLGDSIAHEAAFAEWATLLSEYASISTGAPEVRLRGRLEPPPIDEAASPWTLRLEVVPLDGQVLRFADIWEASTAATAIADGPGLSALRTRLRDVIDRLGAQLAVFADLADESAPDTLALSGSDVSELLGDGAAICAAAGMPIHTPDGLVSSQVRLTAAASTSPFVGAGFGSAMIDVDWGLALGDYDLTPDEIEELARSSADIVALRGEWVQIDRRQIDAALRRLDTQRRDASELSAQEFLQQTVQELDGHSENVVSADGWIAQLLDGLPDDELGEVEEPPGFQGTLRPYQRRAVGWLQFLGRLGLGGCLADDMGLGKTPTALAHLLSRTLQRVADDRPHRPHLVICPLSVVTNWEREAERFTPALSVRVVHGPDRPRGPQLLEAAAQHDVLITTYATASRIADDLEPISFDVVVFDEAQAIKNHRTNAAITIRALDSEQRIGLTGTPVENRLTELWAILDALNPGMLGGITWFKRTFAAPIEADNDEEALGSLRRLTSPFVLRRTKADKTLVPELPDKIEQVAWASLTPEQAGLYQALVDDFFAKADIVGGMERRGLVLSTLTKLKQVCNHPAHFLGEAAVGDTDRSGKLERLDELVDQLLEAEERALIFTQYRAMGDLLAGHLSDRLDLPVPFLHGGTTIHQREAMVEAFQGSDGPPIQLISLRAGGTGLNLTAASRVIHYDRWWNPAVEDQATDRTWRIGQDKTVFVHKMVCRGTLEERIDALLTEKRALADAVVRSDESWLTELTTEELRETLRLEASAISARDESSVA